MNTRRLLISVGIALLSVMLAILLNKPLSVVEDEVTALKYRLRGEQRADTNIVLIYLDNDAMKTLGFPIRRNYYALMVRTLNELSVKAIGIDVLFEDFNVEYPEYDELLANVLGDHSNVVLSSYFRSVELQPSSTDRNARGFDKFSYPHVDAVSARGSELHLPLPLLMRKAAGIGHSNIAGALDVPVFLAYENALVPALGAELLRVYLGAGREALTYDGRVASFAGEARHVAFPTSADGTVSLLFPGRLSAFVSYPFIEVLKSYDAVRQGLIPSVPIQCLKGKLVLMGVVAEGRSETRTFNTPVDPRFPALGMHAVFLDDALRSGFLSAPPAWLVHVASLLLGTLAGLAVLALSSPYDKLASFGVLGLSVVLSLGAFGAWSFNIPLLPMAVVLLVSTAGSLVYKHRVVHQQLNSLQKEKGAITEQLKDREAKLAVLERELLDFETRKSIDRTKELQEEIQKYKSEIRALTSRANDIEEHSPTDDERRSELLDFEGIMYEKSGRMKTIVDFIAKIAASEAPVLILGESGTGKELVARAIHRRSQRAGRPFVAVNCGALAESLLESELFGHEKGAFTGAVKDKLGRFELADGGTLFLDEIGEVSEGFQLKLLRVLQEGELERVGGGQTIKVSVRVVAATNKDLKEQVKAEKFREDLYYRLNMLTVELPPLRERDEDIPLLVRHFLHREDAGMKLSKNVMDILENYTWPGNIRQLESVVRRAVLLAKADKRGMISLKDIPEEVTAAVELGAAIEDQILASLREKGFSRSAITETAGELGGLSRGTVAEYLRGQVLKAFAEHAFQAEATVQYISLSSDARVNDRVRKKLNEYLVNIAAVVDKSQPWEQSRTLLKPKTKNLPQRYHSFLEKVAEGYFRGLWKAEGESDG